jgi:hypothetical protein
MCLLANGVIDLLIGFRQEVLQQHLLDFNPDFRPVYERHVYGIILQ